MDPTIRLTEDDIVYFCSDAPASKISYFGRVIRIHKDAVVKFGVGVTIVEADSQRLAAQLLKQDVVRVPRVYRFFIHEKIGYLVMEYIAGKQQGAEEMNDDQYQKLFEVLSYFQTIRRDFPGTLSAYGLSYNCPFTETGVDLEGSVTKMEDWFRAKVVAGSYQFDFQKCEYCFCHRDLAPRNIIWQENGSICLLDWQTAGFYPITFEVCSQRIGSPEDFKFNQRVEEFLSSLSPLDTEQINAVAQAWWNCQKYTL